MHGKRRKEGSLPQGIIKPLGDDDEMTDKRFSLDEALEMVRQIVRPVNYVNGKKSVIEMFSWALNIELLISLSTHQRILN